MWGFFCFQPLELSTCHVILCKISTWKCCLSSQCHDILIVKFVAVQEVSPFSNLRTHLASHWNEHSTVLGVGGVGQGSPTELALLAVREKALPLRTRCEVGKHRYEKFYLTSVLNGFKKFCIWRMEMLIYLLKVLLSYLKLKVFG